MALTRCRECGKDVSTDAATCPHCGVADPGGTRAAVAERTVPVADRPVKRRVKVEERPVERTVVEERPVVIKKGGGFARFLLWIILIMFLAVLGAWFFGVLNFN